MFESTHIELDSEAVRHNLSILRNWYGDDIKLSTVVKGNAYGHGLDEFVPMLLQNGIDHLSVFSANDAYRIKARNKGDYDLMIMGMVERDGLEWAIREGVDFFIFDIDRLESAIDLSSKAGSKAKIHLELETGMNRTGLSPGDFKLALKLIEENRDKISVEGICTHLAGAESISNYHRIKKQRERFKRYCKKLESSGIEAKYVHMACSAASLMYPGTRYNMVRIGILSYGFFPSKEVLISYMNKNKMNSDPLKRVLSWKSKVMDISTVKAGEFIGYGTSYLANIDTKIAIVPVGYAIGFKRSLSNQGRVLIRGSRMSVVGMVNMNMIAVDVTELENVEKGDEVVFIGRQGDIEISVASFSDYSHQVNYELLTRLPQEIPRLVI